MEKKRVLFVCLGNICRSPMGEGLFLHLLEERNLSDKYVVDSAGTANYHVGERPDNRMLRTAEEHGVYLPSKARHAVSSDFKYFDVILAMDQSNYDDLNQIKPNDATADLLKMRDFDEEYKGGDVPDPYFGGADGFEEVFQILKRSCNNLIDFLEKEQL